MATTVAAGYGYMGSPWGYPTTTRTTVSQYTEANVYIDMVDASEHKLVWQGVATFTLTDKMQEQLRETVYNTVDKVFAKYPVPAPADQMTARHRASVWSPWLGPGPLAGARLASALLACLPRFDGGRLFFRPRGAQRRRSQCRLRPLPDLEFLRSDGHRGWLQFADFR